MTRAIETRQVSATFAGNKRSVAVNSRTATIPENKSRIMMVRHTLNHTLRSILVSILALTCLTSGSVSADSAERLHAQVIRIIDGDTIVLKRDGEADSYRLLAIDAPELSSSDHAARQAQRYQRSLATVRQLGAFAKRRLTELLPPQSTVELEFDEKRRDRYGRPLIYLYSPGAKRSINEQLIIEGAAWYYDPSPNRRLRDQLKAAEQIPRAERRGVWAAEDSSKLPPRHPQRP